jgi:hypothetical protein
LHRIRDIRSFVVHFSPEHSFRLAEKNVMAKQQTFGDKGKKKAGDTKISVKVIKAFRSDKGTVKYMERFVKVDDIGQVDKIDFSR